MDSSGITAGKSPRRELQGPRPTPLKLRKVSHKIRKPSVAPQPPRSQAPPREPVIIYTVSPKVIHANPSEFMTLVQRLTGPDYTPSSSMVASSSSSAFQDNNGAISPAARFASIEQTKSPERKKAKASDMEMVEGIEVSTEVEITSLFPGILSPNPSSLQPIPSIFFSPPSDPNPLSFFADLSPVLHSYKNHIEGSLLPSPSNFISPHLTSPNAPSLDLFNSLFDF